MAEAYQLYSQRISRLPVPTTQKEASKVIDMVQRMTTKQFRFPLFTRGFETRALALAVAAVRQEQGEAYYSAGTYLELDAYASRFSTLRVASKLLIDHGTVERHSRPHGGMMHRNYDPLRSAKAAVMHTVGGSFSGLVLVDVCITLVAAPRGSLCACRAGGSGQYCGEDGSKLPGHQPYPRQVAVTPEHRYGAGADPCPVRLAPGSP